MRLVNPSGLSKQQREKVDKPYAHNTGEAVDFSNLEKAADNFVSRNREDLMKVVKKLNTVTS